ncbi:hypothetical protein BsWGS_08815 [Bradybaena similaris]
MMIIVVCLFVLCWLPLQMYNLLATVSPGINEYMYINIIWFSSNWLAMSNSCYNPFIYGLLNEKFKREFSELFSMCPCVKKKPSVYKDYLTEDVSLCRRANNNGHAPNNRHAAIRYLAQNDKKTASNHIQIRGDHTETSEI